jgi:hypothetical protein
MIEKITQYITRLFDQTGQSTYGSELEQYIVSKCPQSAAEIEHWAQQFDYTRNTKAWL